MKATISKILVTFTGLVLIGNSVHDMLQGESLASLPAPEESVGIVTDATKEAPQISYRIVHELDTASFGRLLAGEIRTLVISFANPEAHPWILHSASSTCGCTDVSVLTPRVGPGEELRVNVTLDSQRQSGGHIEKTFQVVMEPGPILFEGTITAEIVAQPFVSPAALTYTLSEDETSFAVETAVFTDLSEQPNVVCSTTIDGVDTIVINPPEPAGKYISHRVQIAGTCDVDTRGRSIRIPISVDYSSGTIMVLVSVTIGRGRLVVTPRHITVAWSERQVHASLFLSGSLAEEPERLSFEIDGAAGSATYATEDRRLDVSLQAISPTAQVRILADGMLIQAVPIRQVEGGVRRVTNSRSRKHP